MCVCVCVRACRRVCVGECVGVCAPVSVYPRTVCSKPTVNNYWPEARHTERSR